ncbi:MAG: MBL fold metallo-hydrolase [Sphaerimonospora mesophila]
MKIQKFRHACLELIKDGVSLVIDPGEWSTDFEPNKHIVGVVITHEHSDHFDKDQLQQIIAKNPAVRIVAHTDIIAQLDDIAVEKQPVAVGETVTVGPFQLQFTGGTHATIHPDYPAPANLGVIVNDGELYYPGDSFVVPDCTVKMLAVPGSAPWMKMAEAMDFITTVKPETCFPTHNALLSTEGQQLADAWLEKAAASVGATYTVL